MNLKLPADIVRVIAAGRLQIKKLFSLFPDKPCNVTLSENCMTNPIKTVSGIIGIGKNVEKQPNNCDICDAKNCIYRNKL